MSPDATSQQPRRRILVAEDEEDLRFLLKLSLGRFYDVEVMGDGAAALEAFDRKPPDMVILDIMMPRMDGFAACAEIRRRSDVPVIMLTALGGVDDVVKGFNLGADDYISKPFTFKELLARIEAVFRRAEWMRTPPPHSHGRQRRAAHQRGLARGLSARRRSPPDPHRVPTAALSDIAARPEHQQRDAVPRGVGLRLRRRDESRRGGCAPAA